MKRYLVFAGLSYDPLGGADDFLYDTDDLTMVVLPVKDTAYMADWVNVLDTKTGMGVGDPRIINRITERLQKRDRLWFQYYVRPDHTSIDPGPRLIDAYRQAGLRADERARVQFFEELSKP